MLDVAVIGCGIVGANVAYLLSQHKLRAAVFEKENDVSMGTTRANSAIVHAGYDPEPGTAMARLNVRGSALTKEGGVVAGLCTGAGVGLAVLLRANKNAKQNLFIVALLYGIGVAAGLACSLFA